LASPGPLLFYIGQIVLKLLKEESIVKCAKNLNLQSSILIAYDSFDLSKLPCLSGFSLSKRKNKLDKDKISL